MQLILVFLGAILGLAYGNYYQGFVFSSDICLFAGLTMIMPTLFKVKLSDIKLVFEHRILMLKGLFVNYIHKFLVNTKFHHKIQWQEARNNHLQMHG